MGWFGLQLVVLLVRGPHAQRYTWFGYEGGFEARNSVLAARQNEQQAEDIDKVAAVEFGDKQKGNSVDAQLTSGPPGSDTAVETGGQTRKEKDVLQDV